MSQSDTVQRILDAAEVLFAQKGFAETSLRAITSRAGVNLAAVNYHFGSKEALIQAVFERYLTPFCQALDAKLEELEEQFTRLKNNTNEPAVDDETESRVPRTIRNVVTGNTFGFLPNWESNPNLEVIEWETE